MTLICKLQKLAGYSRKETFSAYRDISVMLVLPGIIIDNIMEKSKYSQMKIDEDQILADSGYMEKFIT